MSNPDKTTKIYLVYDRPYRVEECEAVIEDGTATVHRCNGFTLTCSAGSYATSMKEARKHLREIIDIDIKGKVAEVAEHRRQAELLEKQIAELKEQRENST